MNVLETFDAIIDQEIDLKNAIIGNDSSDGVQLDDSSHFYQMAYRIMEIAKNSTVLRSGNITGGLTKDKVAFESDGAHTNLVRTLVKYALDSKYGCDIDPPQYTRSEIDEAITFHDLPENITGDIPDNRNRDEAQKARIDADYFNDILTKYPTKYYSRCRRIRRLLDEMEAKSSEAGRIIYVADKLSAIIMMLCYDQQGLYPSIDPFSNIICKISQEEINFCTPRSDGSILLSELWSVDFLYGRKIIQYDDTSFFTALLVMITILVRGEWYGWRKAQYS